jgi:hypothetical protein
VPCTFMLLPAQVEVPACWNHSMFESHRHESPVCPPGCVQRRCP